MTQPWQDANEEAAMADVHGLSRPEYPDPCPICGTQLVEQWSGVRCPSCGRSECL